MQVEGGRGDGRRWRWQARGKVGGRQAVRTHGMVVAGSRSYSGHKLRGTINKVVEQRETVETVRVRQMGPAQGDVRHGRRTEQLQVIDAAPIRLIVGIFILLQRNRVNGEWEIRL